MQLKVNFSFYAVYEFFGVNKRKGVLGQHETITADIFFIRLHNNFKCLHSPKVGLMLEIFRVN